MMITHRLATISLVEGKRVVVGRLRKESQLKVPVGFLVDLNFSIFLKPQRKKDAALFLWPLLFSPHTVQHNELWFVEVIAVACS